MFFNTITKIRAVLTYTNYSRQASNFSVMVVDHACHGQWQVPSSCTAPLVDSPGAASVSAAASVHGSGLFSVAAFVSCAASIPAAVPAAVPAPILARCQGGLQFYDDFFDASFNIWGTDQCAPNDPLVKINHDLPVDMVVFDTQEAMSDRYW